MWSIQLISSKTFLHLSSFTILAVSSKPDLLFESLITYMEIFLSTINLQKYNKLAKYVVIAEYFSFSLFHATWAWEMNF
jgi:hypothetical protein